MASQLRLGSRASSSRKPATSPRKQLSADVLQGGTVVSKQCSVPASQDNKSQLNRGPISEHSQISGGIHSDQISSTILDKMTELLEQHRLDIVSRILELHTEHKVLSESIKQVVFSKVNELEQLLRTSEKSAEETTKEEAKLEKELMRVIRTYSPEDQAQREDEQIRERCHSSNVTCDDDTIEFSIGDELDTVPYLDLHAKTMRKALGEPLLKRSERRLWHNPLETAVRIRRNLTSLLDLIVHGTSFEAFVGIVILCNSVFMGYRAQWSIDHPNAPHSTALRSGIYFFNTFFAIEFILRILAAGWQRFFCEQDRFWNMMDTIIVSSMFFNEAVGYFQATKFIINPSIFRVLRLARIVRIVKVARLAYFLHELRNIVVSLAGGMRILFWSIVLMLIIYYTFAIVIMTAIPERLSDPSIDPAWAQRILPLYGSTGRAVLTLYMATTGGMDWSEAANPLLVLGFGYYLAYLLFNAFVSMALLNVILGSFVDATMKASMRDYVQEMQDEAEDFHMYRETVLDLFLKFGNTSDGCIAIEELQKSFEYPVMKSFLRHVGYHKYEAETLFRAMHHATVGKVDAECFVDACLRLGRSAKGLDVLLINEQLNWVRDAIQKPTALHRKRNGIRQAPLESTEEEQLS